VSADWNKWLFRAMNLRTFDAALMKEVSRWLEAQAKTDAEKALKILLESGGVGRFAFTRSVVACGADPAAEDEFGWTVLMRAARLGQNDITELLIPFNDARATDDRGCSPLWIAAERGNLSCVKALLPASDPKAKNEDGLTAFAVSVLRGHTHCARFLFDEAEAREVLEDGSTLLIKSAMRADADCVTLLLPFSDIQAKDRHGMTALMHAAKSDQKGLCVPLLLPGSDAKAVSNAGRTAFMHAMGNNNREEAAKRLLPLSDWAARDAWGKDALDLALESGKFLTADLLAELVDFERVKQAVKDFPHGRLSVMRARIEREELAQEIAFAKPQEEAGGLNAAPLNTEPRIAQERKGLRL